MKAYGIRKKDAGYPSYAWYPGSCKCPSCAWRFKYPDHVVYRAAKRRARRQGRVEVYRIER